MEKLEGVYVKDSLANAGDYASYGVHFAKAVEFLQREDLMRLLDGRYELDGDNVFAMVQEVTLKDWDAGRPEVHHEYFDIQLPLSGEETIGVGVFDSSSAGTFDEERDIGFYDDVAVEPMTLCCGQFAILHPNTCAHAPCCSENAVGTVLRKIVIKVRK